MEQKLLALTALITMLCLLFTGCSMEQIGSFLTGKDPTASQEDDTPEDETTEDEPPMASESVLNMAEAPDVLKLAYQEEYGLNPFTTVSLSNRTILSLLYEPLYLVTSNFEAEPVLAAGCEVAEDGLTTTITLQRNVKFHDGSTMTAEDVVYSYQLANQSAYYGNRFYHVESFVAQDAYTIVLTTDTAFENACLLLDFPIVRQGTGGVIETDDTESDEAAEEESAIDPSTLVPIGTGPFVYDSSYTLNRFADWWQTQWYLDYDRAAITPCTTATDIRDHFEYSQVNLVCTDPSSAAYATYHSDFERWSCPTTVMQYIGFNRNTKIFTVDAVRACFTYAIDRDTIVAEDLGGFGLPASLPASPLSPCYSAGLAADYDYDLDDFYELLEEAEIRDYTADGILDVFVKDFSRPISGKMIVNASSNQRVASANRIADTLNALGFDIIVEPLEESDYRTALKYNNYDLYYGEIRMSANFDMGSFFRDYGSANYGTMASTTGVSLSNSMLENSGNAYDLHKWVMDNGCIIPVLFKSYALYTTRGAASDLNPAVDWVIH